jgi:hypothetical protein
MRPFHKVKNKNAYFRGRARSAVSFLPTPEAPAEYEFHPNLM